jgi:large subunit ribosomal protein L25
MEEIKLDVQVREEVGGQKVARVRHKVFVPEFVYGGKKKSVVINFDRRNYERIRRQHAGENIIFHLNVIEAQKTVGDYPALVKEEQLDPVSDKVLHVDFKRISLKQEIEVKVSLVPKGEALGVKRDGGSLEQVMWELDVICLPTNIPHHIDVDVQNLAVGEVIQVKDLQLPEGVKTKHDLEAITFTVSALRKEEEIVPAEAPGPSEPEVTKEKKAPEGEGAEKKEVKKEVKKETKK